MGKYKNIFIAALMPKGIFYIQIGKKC